MSILSLFYILIIAVLAWLIIQDNSRKKKNPTAESSNRLVIQLAVVFIVFVLFHIFIVVLGAYAWAAAEARRGG